MMIIYVFAQFLIYSTLNASYIPQNFSCSVVLYQQGLWMIVQYVLTPTRNTLEARSEFRLEMLLSVSAGHLEFTQFRECDRCDLYSISLTIKYFPF